MRSKWDEGYSVKGGESRKTGGSINVRARRPVSRALCRTSLTVTTSRFPQRIGGSEAPGPYPRIVRNHSYCDKVDGAIVVSVTSQSSLSYSISRIPPDDPLVQALNLVFQAIPTNLYTVSGLKVFHPVFAGSTAECSNSSELHRNAVENR